MRAIQVDQSPRRLLKSRGTAQHQSALKSCGRHGDLPASALLAQQIEGRHAHIIKEDLGKTRQPIQLLDGSDRDALGAEWHQDFRQPVMPLRVGVSAKQTEDPICKDRSRRPDLLPIDHVVVAIPISPAADGGHVGARVGLGPSLRPNLISRGHCR